MPRYFFNMEDGPYPEADDGIELAGPEQARAAALTFTGEMLREIDGRFWLAVEWRLRITDEQGATLCVVTVRGTTGEA